MVLLRGKRRPCLGFIGLNRIDQENSHVQLGFFLGEQEADGERCLSEAVDLMTRYVFAVLGMNRLWLYVDATATQTINLLEQQVSSVKQSCDRTAVLMDGIPTRL